MSTLPDIPIEQYVRLKEAIQSSLREVAPKEPCATCGHTEASHSMPGGKCAHCAPKGSDHSYRDTPDIRPLTARVTESMYTEYDGACTRIQEAMYSPMYGSDTKEVDKSKQKAGQAYNSHSDAAHRQSVRAYQNGNSADHETAATHHELAAKAANDAAGQHAEKTIHRGDYETAAKYHAAQAAAHKAAAKTLDRNNSTPYTSSYSNY